MAGASVLTDIIIGKFMYLLPFYRLIQQYCESGITISDSTMGGWYEAAVEKLKLLYNLLKKQILLSEYIQIDESVIPVIDNEKHKTRKGYEWCLRTASPETSCSITTVAAAAERLPVNCSAIMHGLHSVTAMRYMNSSRA